MAESEKQFAHCLVQVCRKRGAPFGNQNALKHGRYTAEAKAQRRYVRDLLCEARATIKLVTDSGHCEAP